MAKRRRNWDWPRISGWFALLFAPARADARFARTKGDYVRLRLQCLLGIAAPSPARAGRGIGAQGRSATRGGRGKTSRALLWFCPQRSSILRARSSVTGSTRAQMRQPASPYSSSSTDPYLCRKETTSPRS